jgi:hypothetical protein
MTVGRTSWRSVLVALLLTSALSSGVAPATDTGPKLTVLNPMISARATRA